METTVLCYETCSREELRMAHSMMRSALTYGQPGYDEGLAELRALEAVGVRRFAKPEVPGCSSCEKYSVFGGPNHRNSSYCQSGKRPHCTCDYCF